MRFVKCDVGFETAAPAEAEGVDIGAQETASVYGFGNVTYRP